MVRAPAWAIRVDSEDPYVQVTSSAGNGASTLTLKLLMGGVTQNPKQRTPMAPQNGDLSPQKLQKKSYTRKI